MALTPERVCALACTLGEGPAWIGGALWFVDIKAPAVHRLDPASGALRTWPAPAQVGWVLPGEDGLLVGLQTGLARFDPDSGAFTPLVDPEPGLPGNRLNDACSDPAGRLWFGTMDDAEVANTGAIWRADARGIARVVDGIAITNGPAVSPDGRTLYHNDTLGGRIYASTVREDGSLAGTHVFALIPPSESHPDGPVVDAEGCLWVGLYAGWSVRRYAPDGRLLATVRFPVANVTKIAITPDGTAYATTAAKGLSPEERAAQPMAGDLFRFAAGVAGQKLHPVAPFATTLL